VRFAASEKKEYGENLKDLVEQLGAEEYDLREDAMAQIRKLGAAAVPALKEYLNAEDEEVKSRVEKLIEELEEEEEEPEEDEVAYTPIKGDEDEVVTRQFTAMGTIIEKSFDVKTRYGQLVFNREDIVGVIFQEPLVLKKTFQLGGQHLAGKDQWLDTGVELEKEEEFELAATGTITIQNYGNTACGPEGTTNISSRYEKFPTGSLVAKVGQSGKPFLVGSEYKGKAEAKGKLFLGIALKTSSVGGNFDVELEKEKKEEEKKESTEGDKESAKAAATGLMPIVQPMPARVLIRGK
jgi:hypothetical protein